MLKMSVLWDPRFLLHSCYLSKPNKRKEREKEEQKGTIQRKRERQKDRKRESESAQRIVRRLFATLSVYFFFFLTKKREKNM
jgi:hypothetical protein